VGPELKAGDRAPDFSVVDLSWSRVTLASTGSRARLFSVVPSLDTGICSAQTKRMNDEAARLGDRVGFYTFSMDLPFGSKRWCGDNGVANVTVLADHIDASFGLAYGTLVKERRHESRAIFVLDAQGILRHVEYVKEMAEHPNYEAALAALSKLV
jgi:thiol peroxidase